MRTPLYVAVALALIAFGVAGMLSVGAPFLLTGAGMLAVLPWRDRPGVLMAAVIAPWAFVLGYVLVGPLGCTSSGGTGLVTVTSCANVLGIDYSGGAAYQPPLMPAVAGGLVAAMLAVVGLHAATRRKP